MSNQTVIVSENVLTDFCASALERIGVPAEEASLISTNLVEADLRNVASHGVVRLPIYVQRIEDGGSNPAPRISIKRETRSTAVMDGDNGMGQIVGIRAMELAIEKAKDGDPAFVSVFNSNHYGAASHYAEMAARADMIGMTFTIGGINHMTPWGGAEAMLGNNPFAVAMPTDREFSFVLDMACSVAARGKIIVAAKSRTPIPADWATDADGLATTDPVEALKGFVQPIAGPKGYALTMTVGLLSTMLSGAAFGSEVTHMYEKTTSPQNVGHLFGVLPISSFEDVATFRQRMGKAIDEMHNTRRAPGVGRIYVPGEREYLSLMERRTNGIPIDYPVFLELKEIAEKYDISLSTIDDSSSARR